MLYQYEQLRSDIDATTFGSNITYPLRFHKDIELQYVLEGFLEMSVDGQQVRLESGDLCVVFPNILHSITAQSCRKYLLTLDPAMVPAFRELVSQKRPVCPMWKAAEVSDVVRVLLARCVTLCSTGDNPAALQAHAGSIFSELLPNSAVTDRDSAAEPVQRIVEFILTNYTQDISLEQLSQALGYSKYYISHLIADTFSCNFRTLLNNYRIHAAQEMLRHTGKNINQILYDCGFQTQSAFNRAFQRCCGMTPMQYRRSGGHTAE